MVGVRHSSLVDFTLQFSQKSSYEHTSSGVDILLAIGAIIISQYLDIEVHDPVEEFSLTVKFLLIICCTTGRANF